MAKLKTYKLESMKPPQYKTNKQSFSSTLEARPQPRLGGSSKAKHFSQFTRKETKHLEICPVHQHLGLVLPQKQRDVARYLDGSLLGLCCRDAKLCFETVFELKKETRIEKKTSPPPKKMSLRTPQQKFLKKNSDKNTFPAPAKEKHQQQGLTKTTTTGIKKNKD